MRGRFADRTFIYATLSVVIAPAATIRLVALAIGWGLLTPAGGLALLVAGPPALGLALVAVAWRHGCTGRDPLDRVRARRTVREDLPEEYHDALSGATLDQPAAEGVVPTRLFVFGLCYAVVVPVVSLVVML
ncbi:MAG: hypothetical protein V5A44_02030 [Haloarculaceae archaeon]